MNEARPIRTALLATALALAATLAGAQTMYRCGNVYSQTPCASDAATVRPRANAVADTAPGPQGAELCSATAARELGLDDGAPVQVASVAKAPAEVIQYADKPTATRKYVVSLKVKSALAVYDGPRTYACHLSEDERRVLQFGAARP
jgi:hypothetical protein